MRTRQGLCTPKTVIRLMSLASVMQVSLIGGGFDTSVEIDEGMSIRNILLAAKIHPSTVIVSHDDRILPHNTLIDQEITLSLIVVSSGG
jgi:sulfur carrier protein ThiS